MGILRDISRTMLHKGIARTFFLKILGACLAATVAVSSILLHNAEQGYRQEVQNSLDMTASTYQHLVEEALWLADQERLVLTLDSLTRLPHISFAQIFPTDAPPTARGIKPKEFVIRSFPLSHDFRGERMNIGELQVHASLDGMAGRFLDNLLVTVLLSGCTTLFIGIVFYTVFHLDIGRHLRDISGYAKRLDLTESGSPLVLHRDRPSGEDEFDDLVSSINTMRDTLVRDIREREKTQAIRQLDEERLQTLLHLHQHPWRNDEEITAYVLEEAVRLTRSTSGYLHFYNADRQTIGLFAWSKKVMETCTATKTPHYPLAAAGIWADCIRRREPVIHNDYPAYPEKKGLPLGHFPLHRHMSVPILDEESIAGVIGVGNKSDPYDTSDVRQLTLLAQGMWRFIQKRRDDAERKSMVEQLHHAQKLEAIGTLAGGIAHDFNNILAAILGFAEMVMADLPAEGRARGRVEQIFKAGKRAKDLVQQ